MYTKSRDIIASGTDCFVQYVFFFFLFVGLGYISKMIKMFPYIIIKISVQVRNQHVSGKD
jgi:hypothetical protein